MDGQQGPAAHVPASTLAPPPCHHHPAAAPLPHTWYCSSGVSLRCSPSLRLRLPLSTPLLAPPMVGSTGGMPSRCRSLAISAAGATDGEGASGRAGRKVESGCLPAAARVNNGTRGREGSGSLRPVPASNALQSLSSLVMWRSM